MSDTNFSPEEIQFIKNYAVRQSFFYTLTFYIAILFAPFIFAIYGLINEDSLAVFIAFFGLLAFIVWYLTMSLKSEKILNEVCKKVGEDKNFL